MGAPGSLDFPSTKGPVGGQVVPDPPRVREWDSLAAHDRRARIGPAVLPDARLPVFGLARIRACAPTRLPTGSDSSRPCSGPAERSLEHSEGALEPAPAVRRPEGPACGEASGKQGPLKFARRFSSGKETDASEKRHAVVTIRWKTAESCYPLWKRTAKTTGGRKPILPAPRSL